MSLVVAVESRLKVMDQLCLCLFDPVVNAMSLLQNILWDTNEFHIPIPTGWYGLSCILRKCTTGGRVSISQVSRNSQLNIIRPANVQKVVAISYDVNDSPVRPVFVFQDNFA